MFSFSIDLSGLMTNDKILRESIINDYELMKSFYLDNIEIINENLLYPRDTEEDRLCFKLNLKFEMEIDKKIKEIVEEMKFSGLIQSYNSVDIKAEIPYWIKFDLHYDAKFLDVTFYVFWMRRKMNEFELFQEELTYGQVEDIQESIFFSIVENFKNMVQMPEKNVLINWLQEMKEELVIKYKENIPIDEIVFNKHHSDIEFSEQSTLIEDFNYLELDVKKEDSEGSLNLMKARSDRLISQVHKKTKSLKTTSDNNQNGNSEEEYDYFFNDGGIVGDIIIDRGSTFQSHAIRICCQNDVKKYLKFLKTNNKINKATHNIMSYRINEKNKKNSKDGDSGILEGYDEDGEAGAGIRLLGILQKMKVCNVMVVVSRWFGGVFLGNDRFKHINDSAKNLILANKTLFDFQS